MPTFTLPNTTPARWWGLNPWLKPLPIPTTVALTFPAGTYEFEFTGAETRWRYCGPYFSKPATDYLRQGNMLIPVGAVGEYCFQGGWVPSGIAIGSTPPHLVREQQVLYAEMIDALSRNQVGRLLALMIKRRGP